MVHGHIDCMIEAVDELVEGFARRTKAAIMPCGSAATGAHLIGGKGERHSRSARSQYRSGVHHAVGTLEVEPHADAVRGGNSRGAWRNGTGGDPAVEGFAMSRFLTLAKCESAIFPRISPWSLGTPVSASA
jgi:hypothetical protein